jgi:hypothetical protein
MLELVNRCRERLERLEGQGGDLSREILHLLDQETMFKHLAEHHDLRERNILYPTLDRVADAEERREFLPPPGASTLLTRPLAAAAAVLDLPAPVGEGYRSYLRAAVLVCLVAGAALGTLNLTWLVSWATSGVMPRWVWWPALIQAHGDAQLFGWTGLFIMGIASHLLPRLRQRPRRRPGTRGTRLGSRVPSSAWSSAAWSSASSPNRCPCSRWLELVGVTLFTLDILRLLKR